MSYEPVSIQFWNDGGRLGILNVELGRLLSYHVAR